MSTVVLCPSRGRPAAAARALASFLETRRDPGSRLVFVVDDDDPTRDEYPDPYIVPAGGSMGAALRAAASDPDLLGSATSVGMIGDDCRFRTPGWDLLMDGWLSANVGIAWPDDGYVHEAKASHWWLSRRIVDVMGMCHPDQRHLWMDDRWRALAVATGAYRYFGEAGPDYVLVEHLHPLAGKGDTDPTYDRSRPFISADRAFWYRWQTDVKPREVRQLRALTGQPRRVFADWHHPALWEALSIVLEDRFGWELYSPLGLRWTRHGWTFHGGTPGWDARLYLEHPGAVLVGDHHELVEPEYPQRPRKLVTWDQFVALEWDVVIASVGPHQRPFHDLARRRGALYVHHIGDAKRRQDHRARGVTIASAVMPGADVTHHQEFDRGLFAYSPPLDVAAVSSFMLRIATTSGPYRWLADAPGIWWSAVDCVGMRDPGYLAPMARVAERMREAGWVWQDKTIGDGFGHVLFQAAAMGRPLIGHASHYRGLLGERLWEDGVTCIDLDRHGPDEVLDMLRTMGPSEHERMGAAIAARFDELVDFDAEAEAILAALSR